MKTFVFIVVFALLGLVAAQGRGPYRGPPQRKHGFQHRPPHGSPHGPPQGNGAHGPPRHRRPPAWGHTPESDSNDSSDNNSSGSDNSGSSDEDDRPNRFNTHQFQPQYPNNPRRPCRWPHNCRTTFRPTNRPPPTSHTRPIYRPTFSTYRPPYTVPTCPTNRPCTPTPPPTPQSTSRPPWTPTPRPIPPPTNRPPWTPTPRPTPPPTNRPPWTPTPSPTTQVTTLSPWDTTTGTQETTSTGEEEPTTSIAITNCIASCHSTPEYNPVCGSNGETYDNEGKLFCAQSCGVKVTLRRRSVCPPPTPPPGPDPQRTPATTETTTPEYMGRTTSLTSFQRCTRQCHINGTFAPVCGTDLVTYMNMERLTCAQGCGEVVQVLCERPCAACGYNPVPTVTPKTSTFAPRTTPSNGRSTTLPDDINDCIKSCPMATKEYKPVCGTDNVTYNNPGHLLCAQVCGVSVAVAKFSACPDTPTSRPPRTTPAIDQPTTPISRSTLTCIRNCPVTSEYNPVCGSDGRTYNNPGHLECARGCGVDVALVRTSRCPVEFQPGTDGTGGTGGTTVSIGRSRDTTSSTPSYTTMSTTKSTTMSTTRSTTMSTTNGITISSSTRRPIRSTTKGVSVDPDVMQLIFGSSTTTPTPSSNEDENVDLDPRFGNPDDDVHNDHSKIIFPE